MADNARQFALGTYSIAGSPTFAGALIDDQVIALNALRPLAQALGSDLRGGSMLEVLDDWPHNFPLLQRIVGALATPAGAALATSAVPVSQLKVHAPMQPRQILCSSANYRRHVIELILDRPTSIDAHVPAEQRRAHAEALMDHRAAHGKPFAFIKANSSLNGPYDDVALPIDGEQPDWELELGLVIGKPVRRVPRSQALDYVAGYTIGNDLTLREMLGRPDIPSLGHDWIQGKCAPGFQTLGPYLLPAAFVPDPQNLQITLKLNGKVMQDESTSDMIFDCARLIEWFSTHMLLLPGDVILTGSPSGNGTHYNRYLQPGDVMDSTITGLGAQRNRCVAEQVSEPQSRVRFEKVGKYEGPKRG